MSQNHSLRKSQLVNIHGPGAIVDLGAESYVVCGVERWLKKAFERCDLARLTRHLRGRKLMKPRDFDWNTEVPGVNLLRFPRWLFCQQCRYMKFWTLDDERTMKSRSVPRCSRGACKGQLVPMRFVRICEAGHLDDIDWNWVVHRGDSQCRNKKSLRFLTSRNHRSGLDSLEVVCSDCKATRNLKELMIPGSLGKQCRSSTGVSGGRQPWQRNDEGEECSAEPRMAQRGDSNVHYSVSLSALDIPENDQPDSGSEEWKKDLEPLRQLASSIGDLSTLEGVFQQRSKDLAISVELVREYCGGTVVSEPVSEDVHDPVESLKRGEYTLLTEPGEIDHKNFMGTAYQPSPRNFGDSLSDLLDSVSQIHRLREVRAFQGFHRVSPGSEQDMIPAALGQSADWIPACEIFGEGIFFQFNRDRIEEWKASLSERKLEILEGMERGIEESGLRFLPKATPELLMIHTFSHLMMRQLCFECGYSASSLKERLYVNEADMCGVLIYTADGDSEGTLGGLVRQGSASRLGRVMMQALHDAQWCSADPICQESKNQGFAGLNGAACHACTLVSEVSCEYSNTLLDRELLIGDLNGVGGYFSAVLQKENPE